MTKEEFYQDLIAHYGSQISEEAAQYAAELFEEQEKELQERVWDYEAKQHLLDGRQHSEKVIRSDVAQECYLQCLAVECGEGECAKAIATKFPELVTRVE